MAAVASNPSADLQLGPPPPMPPGAAAPAADDPSDPNWIEKDSETAERQLSVELLPGGQFPGCVDLFSISVRNAAINGWVKQASPACAAASLAGAFNALRGLERGAPGALSQQDVVELMIEQLAADHEAKQGSAARLLGLNDPSTLNALEGAVAAYQEEKGRPLASRKKDALKPPDLRAAIKEVTTRAVTALPGSPAVDVAPVDSMPAADAVALAEGGAEAVMWRALERMYAEAAEEKQTKGAEGAGLEREPLSDVSGGVDNAEGDEEALLETVPLDGGACEGGAVAFMKGVHRALVLMLQVRMGILKLQLPTPSSAFFGNGDVLKACRLLSEKHDVRISGRPFCGKGVRAGPSSSAINLDAADSADTKETQWRALVAEFSKTDSILLMHLTNHYCMFYAVREWVEKGTDGEVRQVRQVLSAKPGQRPSKWFEWDDLRKMMLSWTGYKVLALKIEQS
jgi:hypothetical protein